MSVGTVDVYKRDRNRKLSLSLRVFQAGLRGFSEAVLTAPLTEQTANNPHNVPRSGGQLTSLEKQFNTKKRVIFA